MSAIYVGTYRKYNNGSIAGAWIDLDGLDKDAFWEKVNELHADEIAATGEIEPMFQDWEGVPKGMVSESYINDELWAWLELDEDDRELVDLYRAEVNQDGTIEQARECFRGKADSETDWAYDWWEETGMSASIPKDLRGYIDYAAWVRDMKHSGVNFVRHNGDVWVFFDR